MPRFGLRSLLFFFALLCSAALQLGCATDNRTVQRDEDGMTNQNLGYVAPESRYSERQYREYFRPQVPKMY